MRLAPIPLRLFVLIFMLLNFVVLFAAQEPTRLEVVDVTSDKARYAPGDDVQLSIAIRHSSAVREVRAVVVLEDLGKAAFTLHRTFTLTAAPGSSLSISFAAPKPDFRGYRVAVRLFDSAGRLLASGAGALDVSSNWRRFPRYGYVANYDAGTPAAQWIADLNRYHINGLQFYDVQYKHHQPVPPSETLPASWPDVAGRSIDRDVVVSMLREAKSRNMTTMAYNASYAAYADAFSDGSGVQLQWGAWPDANGPRTPESVKALPMPAGWVTPRLLYMNQASAQWRDYLFARMGELFARLPFDGWHIDTYGDAQAWDFNGKPIDFVAGFPDFADAAHASLHKPVVLNTVSGLGEASMAHSAAEFVYSELWPDDHATYRSILQAADEIHGANPERSIVFAAYLHNATAEKLANSGRHGTFNIPGVLLADAAVFASGASHIELGDGDRMLARPYFVDDLTFTLPGESRAALKNYYDFLVAYQNYLRDGVRPSEFSVKLMGLHQSTTGESGSVWTIARSKGGASILQLINLTAVPSDKWRDDDANYPPPPVLRNVHLQLDILAGSDSVGWASPDVDQGAWHPLTARKNSSGTFEIVLPELHYWTTVILQRRSNRR